MDCFLLTNNNVCCVTKNLCCSTPFHFLTGGGRQPKKQPAVAGSQSLCRLSHRLIPRRLKHKVLVAIYIYSRVATFVQPSHTGLCKHSRLTHFHNKMSFIFKYTTSFIFNPLKCFIYCLLNFLCPRLFCLITWHTYNVIQYFLWNGLKMPDVTACIMHNVAGI